MHQSYLTAVSRSATRTTWLQAKALDVPCPSSASQHADALRSEQCGTIGQAVNREVAAHSEETT